MPLNQPKINAEIIEWAGLFPPNTPVERPGPDLSPVCVAAPIDVAEVESTIHARIPTMTDQLIVFSAAHELGHATGGQHHALGTYLAFLNNHDDNSPEAQKNMAECYPCGDRDCLMRCWHYDSDWMEFALFLAGKWNLLTPAGGGRWSFCDVDLKNMHLKQ